MKTMAAYRLHTWGQDPDLTTMAAPAAVPRDVLLGAGGAGACQGFGGSRTRSRSRPPIGETAASWARSWTLRPAGSSDRP